MRSFNYLAWAAPAAALLFTGCYPREAEYIDEYDLVLTNYSPTFDFTTALTYSLPDSVVKITGSAMEGERPEMVAAVYGDQVLQQIRQNMNSRGWTEVELVEEPDVTVLPSVFTSTYVSYYYPYDYWGWYYPYGGWYYPGYYPTYVTYTTGTVLMQMAVPTVDGITGNSAIVWTAGLNGVAEGSSSGLVTRVNKGIDQAFDQSSYLNH